MAIKATKQYNIGTPIITIKYLIEIDVRPIKYPIGVYGNIIATMLNNIDDI